MTRTVTRHWSSFQRQNVKYSFTKDEKAHVTTITISPGSDWTSGLHWHESHREFLFVKSGTALITIGSTTQSLTTASGKLIIERGVLHEWKRDPSNTKDDLIVEEWTDPADGTKEGFFRNLCSCILDLSARNVTAPLGVPQDWYLELQLWVIFAEYDNYPVLHGWPLSKTSTFIALWLAKLIGTLLGVQSRYREYIELDGNKDN